MRGCINAGYSCSSSTTTLRYQCRLYHYRHRVLDIHCLPLMIDATSCRTLPLIATGHHHGGGPRSDGIATERHATELHVLPRPRAQFLVARTP
jgi:hypothetical protein